MMCQSMTGSIVTAVPSVVVVLSLLLVCVDLARSHHI